MLITVGRKWQSPLLHIINLYFIFIIFVFHNNYILTDTIPQFQIVPKLVGAQLSYFIRKKKEYI